MDSSFQLSYVLDVRTIKFRLLMKLPYKGSFILRGNSVSSWFLLYNVRICYTKRRCSYWSIPFCMNDQW